MSKRRRNIKQKGGIMDWYNIHRPDRFEDMFPTSDLIPKLPALVKDTLAGGHKLPHVMIFYSTFPGLGKTTTARILASELNPALSAEERKDLLRGKQCPVFEEINGADKRGIKEARELEHRIHSLEHAMFNYRFVFVIDEAHQLTDEAQQTLLSIENMPENVYLIMTSTDVTKFRKDLESRTQFFAFKPITRNESDKLLRDVAEKEGFEKIESSVLEQIYVCSEGAPRKLIQNIQRYLVLGLAPEFDTDLGDTTEEFRTEIKKLVSVLEKVATNGESWTYSVRPVLRKLVAMQNAEEIRRNIVSQIGYKLLYEDISRSMIPLYDTIARDLRDPILYNQRGELVTRLFSVCTTVKPNRNGVETK